MAQDIINQLVELCDRLRDQLKQQPEYRALISLEKTIQDLGACAERLDAAHAPAPA